jgi:hypothetical protein
MAKLLMQPRSGTALVIDCKHYAGLATPEQHLLQNAMVMNVDSYSYCTHLQSLLLLQAMRTAHI